MFPARCIKSLFFDCVVADCTARGRDQPKHVLSIGLRKFAILSQVREPSPESGIGCFSQRYQASRLIVRFHVSWKPKCDGEQKQHDPPQITREAFSIRRCLEISSNAWHGWSTILPSGFPIRHI